MGCGAFAWIGRQALTKRAINNTASGKIVDGILFMIYLLCLNDFGSANMVAFCRSVYAREMLTRQPKAGSLFAHL
jgi:hypothetical protein